MKIPVEHAVDSGAWFQCGAQTYEGSFIFKIRILSLEKVKADVMRELQKKLRFDDGVLWLMALEAVNLNKEPISGYHVSSQVCLFDQDDFKYTDTSVSDLALTDFGKRIGIERFSGWSHVPNLKPKIKATGAIPYLLPDDESAKYFFSIDGGNIWEI